MADPWSEFKPVAPARPSKGASVKPDPWGEFGDASGAMPTGQAHDGDTFRLSNGDNARLLGVDAFEINQTGRSPTGAVMPLGQDARAKLMPFAQPGGIVTPTGASTYGRPVVTLDNGGDAGAALLRDGLALPQAQYLKADVKRMMDYVQLGRLARLNRRGAYQGSFQTPASFRHGEQPQRGSTEAIFFDEATPNAGLPDSVAAGYEAVQRDPKATAADLVAYAKANGFQINPAEAERYMKRRGDARYNTSIGTAYAPRAPRVLTDPGDGATGAAARGVADPINMLDEMGALADTLLPNRERENLWSSDRRFGDVYSNNLEQNRAILDYDDAKHPYARFGGQLAGGLITPGASIEGLGYRVASEVLKGGGTRFAAEQAARSAVVRRLGTAGAVEGTLAGVGQGENARERFQGALIGGPAGLALGTAAGAAAPALGRLIGRPFNRLAGREGEQAAQDLTDGAIDSAKSRASNDIAAVDRSMPMANDKNAATLIGPEAEALVRPVDRIDVAGKPQQLVADLANAQRLAEAARVQSRDMLPLPANRVDGVDEAARIEAGRYAPVRAPNEDAALSSSTLPSGTTGAPIRKRGPADLVTWLRSEGGIRAQGGELQHYGIDNTPRQGVDFAGGEGRFGKLVRDDGMNYDDAAQRAWEAGFFPDHAERPTINEFLDTLQATHSGGNRAFRADDLAEVDAFEAARRQRFDVERARDDGAPLSEDRSEPVGLDDIDANAAPVQAYEEWGENAPNLAGNIRLDKLDSPQAIKRALAQTNEITGGFDAARRGRITQAETKSLAEDLGMTADDLLKRRKGESFNAEQALAARQLLARSASDLVNMAKRISRVEAPGDELEAAFRGAWLRHAAIQEQVAGMTAEAGRLLQQFRMTADSRDTGRVLASLGETLGGVTRMKEVAERIVDLENVGTSPAGINQFALKSLLPQWRDKAVELYINSLLSGPQTHAVNILSNTLTAMAQLPEHAVAAGIGAVRKALPGQAETDRVLFSELGARAAGMVSGAREGMRAAARSFLTGDAADAVTKVESQQTAIGGKLGAVIRTPTRLLTAEDELFKGIASRMELNGLALRQAKGEGLNGKAARDRAADLVLNPSDDLLKRSMDYARYLTFQTPLRHGSFAANISHAVQNQPVAKLLLPFIRTPMNLLKFAAERSPAALAMKSWRKEFAAGGARRDMAVTRAVVGTGVGAAMYQMALEGHITGGGPADRNARRLLQANGWQPYSFKVGDKYYSYARLDPFSTTIGTVADMVDLQSHMTDKQQERSGTLVLAAIANNLTSKTWLSGLSSALEAVNDPDRYMQNFVSRTAGAIAVPSIVAQVAKESDPILREARGPLDRIQSRIPGLSDELFPRRDVFGRPVEQQDAVGPDIISPLWTGTGRKDPTIDALLEAGAGVTPPPRSYKVGRKSVPWTPGQYDKLQELVGGIAKPQLDALVRSSEWKGMGEEAQKFATRKIMETARRQAKAQVLAPISAMQAQAQLGAKMRAVVAQQGGRRGADPWAEFQPAR